MCEKILKIEDIKKEGWSDIGHIGLDIIGFIPAIGEAADFTNAVWYLKEKDYISAVLSLISLIPEAGDIAAKGLKYCGKYAKVITFFIDNSDDIIKWWRMVREGILMSKKLRGIFTDEVMDRLDSTVQDLASQNETIVARAMDRDEAKPIA